MADLGKQLIVLTNLNDVLAILKKAIAEKDNEALLKGATKILYKVVMDLEKEYWDDIERTR